jgi:hypothetical protein
MAGEGTLPAATIAAIAPALLAKAGMLGRGIRVGSDDLFRVAVLDADGIVANARSRAEIAIDIRGSCASW